jgi:hypothetical protein
MGRRRTRPEPAARPPGGFTGKRKDATRESRRMQATSQGLPPLQRVKRAPGEVNPRKGKSGGLNRTGKMIE